MPCIGMFLCRDLDKGQCRFGQQPGGLHYFWDASTTKSKQAQFLQWNEIRVLYIDKIRFQSRDFVT